MPSVTLELDEELTRALDALRRQRGYADRADAIVDLLRAHLPVAKPAGGTRGERLATLSYLYDAGAAVDVESRLAASRELVLGAVRAELDAGRRYEVLILRGAAPALRAFADAVTAVAGVRHGRYASIALPRAASRSPG